MKIEIKKIYVYDEIETVDCSFFFLETKNQKLQMKWKVFDYLLWLLL